MILLLFALELKTDGRMSTEQSFTGVDKIPTYYATFFINKYEKPFFLNLNLLKMIAFALP